MNGIERFLKQVDIICENMAIHSTLVANAKTELEDAASLMDAAAELKVENIALQAKLSSYEAMMNPKVSTDLVIKMVARVCDVEPDQISGRRRFIALAEARFMVANILFHEFGFIAADIERALRRSFSTIQNGIEQHGWLVETNEEYRSKYDRALKMVRRALIKKAQKGAEA
ncbi:MAG: hypothetical protein AAF570_02000 [Bacteroidota bacterium]